MLASLLVGISELRVFLLQTYCTARRLTRKEFATKPNLSPVLAETTRSGHLEMSSLRRLDGIPDDLDLQAYFPHNPSDHERGARD